MNEKEKGTAMSLEDIKFCETLESGVVHPEDLHYQMPLPFKHQNIRLLNNYAQTEKRLNGLERRLNADDDITWTTAALCLISPPKDQLVGWMMSSRIKPE